MVEQNSPTLVPGRRYISVIAPVPVELCQLINDWNGFYQHAHSVGSNHITVLISEAKKYRENLYEDSLHSVEIPRFTVELGEPRSFLPQTPVIYCPLKRGMAHLQEAHEVLQTLVGQSASPFEYVPHLTLLSRAESERDLQEAQKFYAGIPAETRRFSIDKFNFYSYEAGEWKFLTELLLR